jgi:MFS superfamily sulfate permease-like transporter
MDPGDFWRREKHVALNAQPRNFRIAKWITIFLIAALLYWWKGLFAVAFLFLSCVVVGTCLHFLLRWKTKGWTQSWGPYKRIKLDGE